MHADCSGMELEGSKTLQLSRVPCNWSCPAACCMLPLRTAEPMCNACRPDVQLLLVALSTSAGFAAVTGDSSISSRTGDAALCRSPFLGVSAWSDAVSMTAGSDGCVGCPLSATAGAVARLQTGCRNWVLARAIVCNRPQTQQLLLDRVQAHKFKKVKQLTFKILE